MIKHSMIYDLLTAIMICLGNAGDENYNGILKLLDVLLSSDTDQDGKRKILQEDFDIPMTQTIERTVGLMCNLSKGVEEKGMAKGMAKGLAEGMAKGMAEGMAQGMEKGMAQGIDKGISIGAEQTMLEAIKNLMGSFKITAEQAMVALKVPENEQAKFSSMLEH